MWKVQHIAERWKASGLTSTTSWAGEACREMMRKN